MDRQLLHSNTRETPPLQLVPARSGKPTLLFDGVYLHSAYDPEKEAETWAKHHLGENEKSRDFLWIVFGCGLGYHVQALRNLGIQQIIVYEPNASTNEIR